MATIKAYTDLEQSKKLAEILPIESADIFYRDNGIDAKLMWEHNAQKVKYPCWSLSTLLKCLSKIKPQVYTPILFPSEDKWILQFAEYSHGNMCEVSCDNPIDACYEIILKLHEQNLL